MKRTDQILQLLNGCKDGMTGSNIAVSLNTIQQNIGKVLNELADQKLVNTAGERPVVYSITDAGRAHVQSPSFGTEERRPAAPSQKADSPSSVSIGVFTSGELHIEANGKRVVLTKTQAAEMVDFICALPNKIFSDRPSMASLPSRVHRMSDD